MKCILAGFWNVSLFEKQAYWEFLWNLLFKAHLLRKESKAFHQVPQKKQAKHRKRAISRVLHHQSHLLKKTLEHSFPVSLSKFKTFSQMSRKRLHTSFGLRNTYQIDYQACWSQMRPLFSELIMSILNAWGSKCMGIAQFCQNSSKYLLTKLSGDRPRLWNRRQQRCPFVQCAQSLTI